VTTGSAISAAAWRAAIILPVLYLVSMLDRTIFSLMVELLKHDLKLSEQEFGFLLGAAFSVFYAAVGLPLGWLVDRYSRRLIIFTGVIVWSLACAYCGTAHDFRTMLIGRFGLGAGEAVLIPAGLAILGDSFPRERMGLAAGIFRIGGTGGSILSTVLGGLLLGWATRHGVVTLPGLGALKPWQQVLLLIGLPGAFAAFLAFLLPDRRRSLPTKEPSPPVWPFIWERKAYFASVFCAGTLLFMVPYAIQGWGAAFVLRRYHLHFEQVGIITAIGALSTAICFPFWGWAADKIYRRGIKYAHFLPGMILAPLMILTTYLAYVVVNDVRIYVAVVFVNGLLLGLAVPLDAHLQITTPSAYRGRIAALYTGGQLLLANSIAPSLVAFFTEDVFGDPKYVGWSLVATAALATPLASLALVLGRRAAVRAVEATSIEAPDAVGPAATLAQPSGA
jgi:MFS family permease